LDETVLVTTSAQPRFGLLLTTHGSAAHVHVCAHQSKIKIWSLRQGCRDGGDAASDHDHFLRWLTGPTATTFEVLVEVDPVPFDQDLDVIATATASRALAAHERTVVGVLERVLTTRSVHVDNP
jgi:hypothetical protein